MERDAVLQELCRAYMAALRPLAERFGLTRFVDDTIGANARDECRATEEEVDMLSRMCDDERLARQEVPRVTGKSYRRMFLDGDFGRIRKLRRVGIFSKVSAMLLGAETRDANK